MDPLNRQGRVKFEFVRYTRGHGIEIGHGPTKAFPHFLPVRQRGEDCGKLAALKVDRLAALPDVVDGACDFVLACGALEAGGREGMLDWLRCLRVGGHLCVYEPDDAAVPIGHLQALTQADDAIDIVRREAWPWGGWLAVVRKRAESGRVLSFVHPPPARKTACVVRHGGFGDQIQAAALLPALKREGFHVTVMTTDAGRAILEHDPHVDDWFLLDKDQVPGHELPTFWSVTAVHFDRFVNLNESCEGTLLAIPGRPQHAWPHELRAKMLDRNYGEFAAMLAGVPFVPEGRFYPTPTEDAAAQARIDDVARAMNPGPLAIASQSVYTILWALGGSSVHKWTPHQDEVIASILLRMKRAVVFLVGDEACKVLEVGWEKEPRVIPLSGEISIRETLALARRVHAVIGPETGVLNAVAYEPDVLKVVLLSHSSRENLTKHWVNTAAIEGRADCYPCHQIHHTSEFCPTDSASGAALCQAQVDPKALYYPLDADYTAWVKVQMLRGAA